MDNREELTGLAADNEPLVKFRDKRQDFNTRIQCVEIARGYSQNVIDLVSNAKTIYTWILRG